MTKPYHTLILIGRFQPVHNAHAEIIRRATKLAKQLIIIVGSANQPRTYKNPWSSKDRELMLHNVINDLTGADECMIRVEHNIDTIYNDQAWAARVQTIVGKHTQPCDNIGIIGHKKDSSSFYLDMFPQWEYEDVPLIEPLNASSIRDLYFRKDVNMNFIRGVVPGCVYRMLVSWIGPEREQVVREREFIDQYKRQFAGLPYAPVFVTVDAVVICSGHVLMIKRRSEPGKGLWALPGGFLNAEDRMTSSGIVKADRNMQDAMIRELREETGIKVPAPVLVGSIQDVRVFDAVDRSSRGRTITHAHKIVLPDGPLPKVKGMDDAEKAKWIQIAQVDSSVCFEDHYEIQTTMIGA